MKKILLTAAAFASMIALSPLAYSAPSDTPGAPATTTAPATATDTASKTGKPASPVVKKAPTAQQMKMKSCNADAKTKALKGADRKAFMSSCLKAKPAA